MKELKGKVSLVTGASRGIGRAIALALAQDGADVVVNYQRNAEAAAAVCEEVERLGVRARPYAADVGDAAAVDRMVGDVVGEFGKLHVLVNCAGITRDKSFVRMTREQWDAVINANLGGPFNVTRAAVGPMIESGWGRVINVSSIVGQCGNFGQANYAATKGGLIALTMTLAKELAKKNITVNAIAPGFIETDMTAGIPDAVKQAVIAMTPVGRMGKPDEVAAAAAFLASERASYITGQVIAVNGGMYM